MTETPATKTALDLIGDTSKIVRIIRDAGYAVPDEVLVVQKFGEVDEVHVQTFNGDTLAAVRAAIEAAGYLIQNYYGAPYFRVTGLKSQEVSEPPARRPERITEGNALQVMDIYNPHTGEFSHQLVLRGTPEQVRAHGLKGFYHPTQERWHHLNVAANPELDGREAKLKHIAECGSCTHHVDEEIAGYLPTDTDLELAEFVAKCHHAAYVKRFGS